MISCVYIVICWNMTLPWHICIIFPWHMTHDLCPWQAWCASWSRISWRWGCRGSTLAGAVRISSFWGQSGPRNTKSSGELEEKSSLVSYRHLQEVFITCLNKNSCYVILHDIETFSWSNTKALYTNLKQRTSLSLSKGSLLSHSSLEPGLFHLYHPKSCAKAHQRSGCYSVRTPYKPVGWQEAALGEVSF